MLLITDFNVGMSAEITRSFNANDVRAFSKLSGDINPVHLDEKYASETIFGSCIVHGALASSIFSTIFANTLPGPGCIYLKSENKFLKPIYLNEEVIFKVEVTDVLEEKKRLIFKTIAITRSTECIVGTAEIFIP
ncbi:MaoC family dehydratase [uncultured Psychrobacter sp.]|uniref:MaoC family dehydratase n=1 Tax=uncultured Psychrobacter sp. TaxID=259303 RepID=UPI002602F648|nr:MaoC family dehydratase [uncultured Psychrobacter sp.]